MSSFLCIVDLVLVTLHTVGSCSHADLLTFLMTVTVQSIDRPSGIWYIYECILYTRICIMHKIYIYWVHFASCLVKCVHARRQVFAEIGTDPQPQEFLKIKLIFSKYT